MDPTVLSLCSGVGGLDLGVRLAFPGARVVVYVEREAFACEVLLSRIDEGRLDPAPLWTDLKTFDGRRWRGLVDLVVGGYPCQPFSLAGSRSGTSHPSHLYPDVRRIVDEVRPGLCFFENVSGHVSLGLRDVRADLVDLGYRVEAGLFRAEEVGAPHRRERLFILAYADGAELRYAGREAEHGADDQEGLAYADGERLCRGRSIQEATTRRSEEMAAADDSERIKPRIQQHRSSTSGSGYGPWPPGPGEADAWLDWKGPQPSLRRDDDGLASRVDRLRACGNGVVPAQAALALRTLLDRARRADQAGG